MHANELLTQNQGRPGPVSGDVMDIYGNDAAAVQDWLRSKPTASEHSIRSYRQAVSSLLEWLAARSQPLPPDALITLRSHDATSYVRDLLARGAQSVTQPSGRAIAKSSSAPTRRGDSPLSAKTIKHRLTILSSMYAYWMKPRDGGRQIIQFNPFDGLASKVEVNEPANTGAERAFGADEQRLIEDAIERLPKDSMTDKRHYRRARLVWMLASRMALRRAEIAKLKVNDFKLASSGKYWKLEIFGKGRKTNQKPDVVIVPDAVMHEIREYRNAFGMNPNLLPSDASHLVRHIHEGHRGDGLSDAHVGKIMKEIFNFAADLAEREFRKPFMAQRLRSASAHWGRHTWFMNTLKEHEIHLVSRAGRHRDIRTTMKSYVGTSEEDLARVMGVAPTLSPRPQQF